MIKKTANISVNSAILFITWTVSKKNEECNFEKLTKECFESFPEMFSLASYPLPDSRKLDRPLRFLKSEKMIKPDLKGNFVLTKKGVEKAKEISKSLRQEKLGI